jgi:hypothetical protein
MIHILAATFALLLAAGPARAQDARWDARLAGVSGDVTVLAADGSPEVSGEAGMPLEEGDRVVVADGGSAEIALDGGSLITVRENSDFKLEKTAKGESSFYLELGSLLAKIQKLGDQRLKVRTPTAVAAVRGTEFGVEVEGENSHVGVFDEGKVEVSGGSGGTPELLISNQESSVLKGQPPTHATQLQRFMANRAQMRGQRRRLASIKAKWKTMTPEQRGTLRKDVMARMRAQRQKFLQKRAALKQGLKDKRKEMKEKGAARRAENLRHMDEQREKFNRGGKKEPK